MYVSFYSLCKTANFVNHQYATRVAAVLERFGQVPIVEELNGSQAHRLENVMSAQLHIWFNKHSFWLEATVNPIRVEYS